MNDTRPSNLDGLDEQPVDEHGYRHFTAGPVDVRGFDPNGPEPDGELVTTSPVMVHIERMDKGFWWMGLDWEGGHFAIEFHSKKRIHVRWRDER